MIVSDRDLADAITTARAEARNQALEEAAVKLDAMAADLRCTVSEMLEKAEPGTVSIQCFIHCAEVSALDKATAAIRALIAPAGEG